MRFQGLIIASILLCGCSTLEKPFKVLIPIPAKQTIIELPKKPYLPIAALKPDSKPDVVAKAYVSSIQLLIDNRDAYYEIAKTYQE